MNEPALMTICYCVTIHNEWAMEALFGTYKPLGYESRSFAKMEVAIPCRLRIKIHMWKKEH